MFNCVWKRFRIFSSYVIHVQEKHVNLIHIESRKSKRRNSDFEIFVDCDTDHKQLKELTQLLRKHTDIVEMTPLDNSTLPDDGGHILNDVQSTLIAYMVQI